MRARFIVTAVASVFPFAAAVADDNKYNITTLEKAACTADAMKFCSHTYPDQEALLGCLKTNVRGLSLVCSVTFKAGLKRRHIQL